MSVTTAGRMATDRPERYLKQLCSHLGNKLDATHEGGEGRIVLGAATATLTSTPTALEVAIASVDDADAHRLMGVIGSHLERFGEKEGLTFEWDDAGHAAAAAAARAEHVRQRQAEAAAQD